MGTYRIHKTRDYTVMSNSHFREKQMSLKAKGLLSLMLSLPDEWDYSIAGLVMLSRDGKDSVMAALNEIEEFGYLKRTRTTDEKGQFSGYDYDIYECPQRENPYAENPNTDNPNTEKPNAENPPQLNTNSRITKETKTNRSSTYKDIVEFLNEKAGTKFRSSGADTQKHINARLNEGFTIDDFKSVIEKKCAEWRGTNMEQYLRPSTLFGTKFESYLNAKAGTAKPSQATTETINGKEYYKRDGKYYLVGGSNVAVDPFAEDDITAF
mgnify:CR=1 FL=1